MQGSRQSGTTREFTVNFGMTQTTGHGASAHNVDGVTAYIGHDAQTNTGDGWALNVVTNLAANIANTGHHFHGIELDFNNVYADYTALSPLACGMSITGAGTFLSSCAMLIAGTKQSLGVDPIWTSGIALVANSIRDFSILDTTNSAYAHYIGGTKGNGIDMSSATLSGYAMNFGAGHVISWNSGDVTLTHASNSLTFAGASSGYYFDSAIVSSSGTPSIGALSGLGTSPSASVAGGASGGVVTLTTGSGSPASAGTFTLSWPTAFPTGASVVLTALNGSGAWNAGVTFLITSISSTQATVQWANGGANLSTATTYRFTFAVIGH